MLVHQFHLPLAYCTLVTLSHCSGAAKARAMAYFGEGQGPIHLDSVECRGTEHSLGQCIRPDTGIHSCWHSEDAGVICDYVEEKVQDIRRTGDVLFLLHRNLGFKI